MNAQRFRLETGGRIDRERPVDFRFDGAGHRGFAGDTLASALLAEGVHLVGRSFKYHRPRGILAAGSEEPNALVEVGEGARRTPNTRMTEVELEPGLVARSQNRWPSRRFDLQAVNQLAAPLLVAGFYYKTFKAPAAFWERVYEPLIRRAAGLGRPPAGADPDRYEHAHLTTDVLVVGAGAAGLMAATAARAAGARVVLVDEQPWPGGALLAGDDRVDGEPGGDWARAVLAELDARVLMRTTAFGVYEDGVVAAVEHCADGPVRERLWTLRCRRIVVAAGGHERPLLFANNDRPGIMLAGAMRRYLHQFAVVPGRRAVVATTDDEAYRTALDLAAQGCRVQAVVDARSAAGPLADRARAQGIEVLTDHHVVAARGRARVVAVDVVGPAGGRRIPCDCVAMSAGFQPAVQLPSQAGARPRWDEGLRAFVVDPSERLLVAGAARGVRGLAACVADGLRAGLEAAGGNVAVPLPAVAPDVEQAPPGALPLGPFPGKAFVDFQNDVTVADLELAVREGYGAAEHAKRYTTLAMATDQGKTSAVNGLEVLAALQGRAMEEAAPTTFRPPYTGVTLGALAGRETGAAYQPIRRTALHDWHLRHGAVMVEAGHWLRPRYYATAPGADLMTMAAEEAMAVRSAVGLCDVSTLGRIDLFGADAAAFLDRIYVNRMATLPVGRVRYGLMLREDGFAFDDGTAARLREGHFVLTTTTANARAVLRHLDYLHQCRWPELDVAFTSATEAWCAMALAGPRAREVLATVLPDLDVANAALPFMALAESCIAGVMVRVFRISYSGELGYELTVPWGYGEALWERLLEAGAPFGIRPYGTEALAILRIEKGHVAGNELDGRTTAADLGLGRMVSQAKLAVGQVLARRLGLVDPERPALVGLRPVDGAERLRGGAHLVADRARATIDRDLGWVSSVHWSPHMASWIGLGFVAGGLALHDGGRLWAVYPLKGEAVEVTVASPCFVDPVGERLRG